MQSETGFLAPPPSSPEAERMYAADLTASGYVDNLTHVWAYQPGAHDGLFDLMRQAVATGGRSPRQRAVLVAATASRLGDSYCSLAWGSRLAAEAGAELAAAAPAPVRDAVTFGRPPAA